MRSRAWQYNFDAPIERAAVMSLGIPMSGIATPPTSGGTPLIVQCRSRQTKNALPKEGVFYVDIDRPVVNVVRTFRTSLRLHVTPAALLVSLVGWHETDVLSLHRGIDHQTALVGHEHGDA